MLTSRRSRTSGVTFPTQGRKSPIDLPAPDGAPGSGRREDGDQAIAITPTAARHRVGELLERAGVSLDSVVAADALMITTELVTNAVRHGGGLTLFRIAIADNALHLSVGDASSHTPVARPSSLGRPGGYGWPLVQRLAAHVGITALPEGKIINAVLRLT
ncbi:ATP-binding protein [Streptomyces sp. 24-1644]|uniref:ATP-binding protein n=1 Tax=Streptomyces sp. 24-1644 TaxID=3457315 RepID=UPI003FA7CE3C